MNYSYNSRKKSKAIIILSVIAGLAIIGTSIGVSVSLLVKSDFFNQDASNPTAQNNNQNKEGSTTNTNNDAKQDDSTKVEPKDDKPSEEPSTPSKPTEEEQEEDKPVTPDKPSSDDTVLNGIYTTTDKHYSMDELKEGGYINFNYTTGKFVGYPSQLETLDPFTFYIPEGITYIDSNSFKNCSKITKIFFPKTLETIKGNAFHKCANLVEAKLPENINKIEDSAFNYCESLKSIYVPAKYTDFNPNALRYLKSVEEIKVSEDNPRYDSRARCNAVKKKSDDSLIFGCKNTTYPTTVTSIATEAFYACKANFSFILPSSINSIGTNAFFGSGVNKVVIDRVDVSFGNNVFSECYSLTSASIPDEMTNIPYGLFNRCENLAECNFPSSAVVVGELAFNQCKLLFNYDFLVPKSLKRIEAHAFAGTALTSFKFHDSYGNANYNVNYVGVAAFKDCPNLAGYIFLSDKITEVGSAAFSGCSKVTDIWVFDSVSTIGANAFECSKSVKITYVGTKEDFDKIYNNPYKNDSRVHYQQA